MAFASQTSAQTWQAPVWKWMQLAGSMTGWCGTACMNGTWTGVIGPSGRASRTSAASSNPRHSTASGAVVMPASSEASVESNGRTSAAASEDGPVSTTASASIWACGVTTV